MTPNTFYVYQGSALHRADRLKRPAARGDRMVQTHVRLSRYDSSATSESNQLNTQTTFKLNDSNQLMTHTVIRF